MNVNMDTIERLRRMAPPTGPVGEDVVQQDVFRGRAAVTRAHRRQAWAASGIGGLALAAVIAGGIILPSTQVARDTLAAPTSGTHPVTVEPVMQLVSYAGAQPDGYHLGKVPSGFTVETSDGDNLILAPTGDNAASLPNGTGGYSNRIVISQQDTFGYEEDRRDVIINGKPALIALSEGDEPATEVQFDTGDHSVSIQIWNTIELTDQQIIDFAQNITVTGNPTTFVG